MSEAHKKLVDDENGLFAWFLLHMISRSFFSAPSGLINRWLFLIAQFIT